MAKSKDTPAVRAKIEMALIRTGSDKVAIKKAGIHKDTYYHWIKVKPDFSDLRARARERFITLQIKANPELEEKAIQSLEELLGPREITKTEEKSRVFVDRDTGQPIRVLDVTKKITTHTRDADLNAILKVLGPGTLEQVLWRMALRKALADPEGELYEHLFGKEGSLQRNKEWGADIISDVAHMDRLEELQKQTQRRYEDGMMSFEEYHKATIEQAKVYSLIQTQIETRAEKSIGTLTYSEVIAQVRKFIELVMRVTEEVINDVSIKKEDIRDEIARRVRERSGTELPVIGHPVNQAQ